MPRCTPVPKRCGPSPSRKYKNYSDLVDYFIKEYREHLKTELDGFSCKQGTFADCVKKSARSLVENSNHEQVMHGHQCRVGKQRLNKLYSKLKNRISDLNQANDFNTIYAIVEECAGPISGVGLLATYDVSLRIAWRKGITPDEVFLQRGARDGARHLLPKGTRLGRSLPLNQFPKEFRKLEPYEMEVCLCVHKGDFEKLKK